MAMELFSVGDRRQLLFSRLSEMKSLPAQQWTMSADEHETDER